LAKSGVRVDVDWAKIEAELVGNVKRAQAILDVQVIKDTTPYVPRDRGDLAASATRATDVGSGEVVWGGGDADYAARQYYGLPNKAHDVHPLAVKQWFEAAKSVCREKWLRVAKKAGGR
jgi:hypothetical protein